MTKHVLIPGLPFHWPGREKKGCSGRVSNQGVCISKYHPFLSSSNPSTLHLEVKGLGSSNNLARINLRAPQHTSFLSHSDCVAWQRLQRVPFFFWQLPLRLWSSHTFFLLGVIISHGGPAGAWECVATSGLLPPFPSTGKGLRNREWK